MPHDKHVDPLVDQMSLEEQVSLLSGEDLWSLPAIPRLAINKLRVTDGPNGARGSGTYVDATTAAAFPAAISLGATWNTDLIEQVGQAIAQEVKSKCAHVSLAPTVNIHRSVTNGRNFECFSEDPELTAALATSYIQGQQSEGVASTIKHFAGNESEFERTTINSVIDERTLRELYLRPFEDAVKKAGVWAVMSSYNKLNGTYTAENQWLLTDTLRNDWGFDGVVMSDWYGSRSTAPTINAGLDLEMPGPTRDRGDKLLAAVEAGEVSRDTIRARAMAIVKLMCRVGSIDDDQPFVERSDDQPSHRALIRKAGAEGTVLLKNQHKILPLNTTSCGTIAVIGPNAKTAQIMGGGSAQLTPHYRISPWDGLVAKLGEQGLVYAQGCSNYRWEPLHQGKTTVAFYDNQHWAGEPVYQEILDKAIAFWDTDFADNKVSKFNFSALINTTFDAPETGLYNLGFHCAGYAKVYLDGELVLDATTQWQKGRTFFEEGCDEIVVPLQLEAGKSYDIEIRFCNRQPDNIMVSGWRLGISQPLGNEGIQQAVQAAASADTAIVFVGRSGEWDTEGSDLENISLPGSQNQLVEAVLKANPNTIVVLQTGGPVEMPWLESVPALLQAWYPGQECGNAIADVIFGDQEPSGRLPQTFPRRWSDNPTHTNSPLNYPGQDGNVAYGEGLNIGYRHYDQHDIAPLFPFGFGLSYTNFELSDLVVNVNGQNRVAVTVTVENTGERAGAAVLQLYTSELSPTLQRPNKELKRFAKPVIEPGERASLSFTLTLRDFAYCDVESKGWRVNAGQFMVSVGFNAAQIDASAVITLEDDYQGY
ncbi:glycosyl hydrolase [Neiella marina]|uniref:Glycosyl hydrolase n=1 Tax=Neiella marina TaxID=508461 RepID=A0A8J2XN60_9GAMM|nr:glycoside hydrolase family 3 C-terminal domain-containing protein [Neiella marina]GGA70794.1 glycosyl hydrolase [Neiella marina]